MAHSSWLWVAPRPCCGSARTFSATLRTVLSSTTTSNETTSTARMAQRLGCPVFACTSTTDSPRFEKASRYGTVPYRISLNLRRREAIRNRSVLESEIPHCREYASVFDVAGLGGQQPRAGLDEGGGDEEAHRQ